MSYFCLYGDVCLDSQLNGLAPLCSAPRILLTKFSVLNLARCSWLIDRVSPNLLFCVNAQLELDLTVDLPALARIDLLDVPPILLS